MHPLKTILLGTDFSASAEAAFRLACAFARDYGARLVILHAAAGPVVAPVVGVSPADPVRYQEELTQELSLLQAAAPGIGVETRLAFATDPSAAILDAAAETRCDLIVLGTHGRTGIARALLGSVAEQVVRRASCPVLTLKMPSPKAS